MTQDFCVQLLPTEFDSSNTHSHMHLSLSKQIQDFLSANVWQCCEICVSDIQHILPSQNLHVGHFNVYFPHWPHLFTDWKSGAEDEWPLPASLPEVDGWGETQAEWCPLKLTLAEWCFQCFLCCAIAKWHFLFEKWPLQLSWCQRHFVINQRHKVVKDVEI